MRVTTAFNRMLGLPGGSVRDVEFSERAVERGALRLASSSERDGGHRCGGKAQATR